MLLGAFPFDTLFSKIGSKPYLTKHERATNDPLQTAKIFISKIAKQLGRSRSGIIRYIKDPKKYGKNHEGKRNSKLLQEDCPDIAVHGKKGAESASTEKECSNNAVSCRRVRQTLSENGDLKYAKIKLEPPLQPRHIKARLEWVPERVL